MKSSTFLSKKEWAVLGISTVLSSVIISSVFWAQPTTTVDLGYSILGSTLRVETEENERLAPFYTVFFAAYEANAEEEEKQAVRDVLSSNVPRLHAYADRRHRFVDSFGQRIHNLYDVNQAYGTSSWLAIDEDFYDLLTVAKQLTIFTNGQFNMFLGKVSDFWDARLANPLYPLNYTDLDPLFNPVYRQELQSFVDVIPMREDDIHATLQLKEEDQQYWVRFNQFKEAPLGMIEISLGAIAKGFANDILANLLLENNLTRGFISNGTSSITAIGPRYGNRPYGWKVTSPKEGLDFAYELSVTGRHALSTSGAYTGIRIKAGQRSILRHHIIDPSTGYPAQEALEINLLSTTYPAGGLDALSTAMMTMNKTEAHAVRERIIDQGYDLEIAWVEIINNRLIVTYTEGYELYLKRQANVRYTLYS